MDVTLGNTREKLYLGGDAYSAPMVYVRDNNSDWVLYDIVRDYQGSITHLVDDSDGTVVAEYSYDPALGRFLSPDPYVQAPDFSQNFNRYAYCLNNPLKYTDEDGEVFLFTLFNAFKDFFVNMFFKSWSQGRQEVVITYI